MSECEIVTEDSDSTLRFCLTHDCPVAYDSCGCWRDRAETAEAKVKRLSATVRRVQDVLDTKRSIIGDPGVSILSEALGGESR